ncbi:MAG: thiamine phosphate synthase [Deltaproteobacteria bacterium]|nr:MAG: thiamine phosphate synthase [Deltaproteobacteria bacterium]
MDRIIEEGLKTHGEDAFDLYCLTSEAHSAGRSNIAVVTALLAAGVRIVQYREKTKSKREKLEECLQIRKMTRAAGAIFIVNDDVDIAILCNADGVHVGQDDLPVAAVRQLVGPDKVIGLSTHLPELAHRAEADGADYIGVGPVYATDTKVDAKAPVGLSYVAYAAEHIKIPFVAIGGIKRHNVADVIKAGATCVAMVTEIVEAPDIGMRIREVRKEINRIRR